MNTHADKTQENKSQSLANEVSQKQSSGESTFQFVDNRPEAVAQRKLQEMANSSKQASQLRAFQNMANGSRQNEQIAQLQKRASAQETLQLAKIGDEVNGRFTTRPANQQATGQLQEDGIVWITADNHFDVEAEFFPDHIEENGTFGRYIQYVKTSERVRYTTDKGESKVAMDETDWQEDISDLPGEEGAYGDRNNQKPPSDYYEDTPDGSIYHGEDYPKRLVPQDLYNYSEFELKVKWEFLGGLLDEEHDGTDEHRWEIEGIYEHAEPPPPPPILGEESGDESSDEDNIVLTENPLLKKD